VFSRPVLPVSGNGRELGAAWAGGILIIELKAIFGYAGGAKR
jgi:hypothetical protein